MLSKTIIVDKNFSNNTYANDICPWKKYIFNQLYTFLNDIYCSQKSFIL